jgi:hypothetical protein
MRTSGAPATGPHSKVVHVPAGIEAGFASKEPNTGGNARVGVGVAEASGVGVSVGSSVRVSIGVAVMLASGSTTFTRILATGLFLPCAVWAIAEISCEPATVKVQG